MWPSAESSGVRGSHGPGNGRDGMPRGAASTTPRTYQECETWH